ncbi:hypothetical protein MPSEU_000139700 [Mayamaea pseudoterrestris]|nr:hypothetical protein MPSEU_000139700 [Mayamaea pseudoterrestris]
MLHKTSRDPTCVLVHGCSTTMGFTINDAESMVKEKTKTRLDKGGSRVEFIGFGAFDGPSSPSATDGGAAAANSPFASAHPVSSWTPVYYGSESEIRLLFPRISQKKDAITKVKALRELATYFCSDDIPKKLQAETLAHFAWLYHHKLAYDVQPPVRAESLSVWKAAADRIPKACKTFMEYYPELCGMLYIAQCDSDAQVALQYRNTIETVYERTRKDWPWQEGLMEYVHRILSYGKPSVMHQALFAKKKQPDEASSSSLTQQLNEQQRDEIEERFERIVGMTLAALDTYIGRDSSELTLNEPQTIWFQTMTSSKPSLRFKTYQLLNTCILKNLEQLLPIDLVTMLGRKVLLSEREASNIPTLLETILVVLSKQRQHTTLFQKPLQKMLSKACYGARVSAWGPTILPLLSFFDNKLPLLQALQDGRPLGAVDTWQLQEVIIECSAFALLQRTSNSESNGKVEDAKMVCQVWLKAFYGTMLTPISLSPAAQAAHGAVMQELAKSLLRFEDACMQQRDCDISLVRDWFWAEGIRIEANTDPIAVAALLTAARTLSKNSKEKSLLFPAIHPFFSSTLEKYRGSSGSVPSDGAYRMFTEALQFFGPSTILNNNTLERFVMNDLLRWLVIHTSALSTHDQNDRLVKYDFGLLAVSLEDFGAEATKIWQSVLTEIVAAKCSLSLLVPGLESLLKSKNTFEWITCPIFDQFAQEVGLGVIEVDDTNGRKDKMKGAANLSFLRMCLGIPCHHILVSDKVLAVWIDRGCLSLNVSSADQGVDSTILLQVLVELVAKHPVTLNEKDVDRIMLTSWYYGSDFFENTALSVLSQRPSATQRFTKNASNYLSQELEALCTCSENDVLALKCDPRRWSEHAWQFVTACRLLSTMDADTIPSLALFGLADLHLWKKYPVVLHDCAVLFFGGITSSKEKIALVERSCDDASIFLATILVSLSQASADAYEAMIVKAAKDRACSFLSCLGGDDLEAEFLIKLADAILLRASKIRLPEDVDALRKNIALAAQVLGILFEPAGHLTDEKIQPERVREGMKLWYITDVDQPDVHRSSVEVVKVHYDAQAGYYFSIKLGSQERQTVAERLRYKPSVPSTLKDDHTGMLESLRNSLLQLIRSLFDLKTPAPLVGELINVLCNVVGLDNARGIGSDHYALVSLTASIEAEIRTSLEQKRVDGLSSALWTVACARGFGINVPSTGSFSCTLPFDPKQTATALSRFYDGCGTDVPLALDEAVVAWFSTALRAVANDEDVLPMILDLLFSRALIVAEQCNISGFSHQDAIVTSALLAALEYAHRTNTNLDNSAAIAFRKWICNFAMHWESGTVAPTWIEYSDFPAIVKLVQESVFIQEFVLRSFESSTLELLSAALFCQRKRHFSFMLLQLAGRSGKPYFEDIPFTSETLSHLQEWTHGFEPEEAEVVEEDVEIVSRWLPRRFMIEIEHWGAEIFEDTDDQTTVARLLMWICVLLHVDVCSLKGFRFRPAFLSYLSESGAVYAALNLAVLNDEAINNDSKIAPALLDVDVLLLDPTLFQVTKLASLVLLQTIDVLPSLSRKWYDESCPKVYISDVQSFVERYVAPELLQRELNRVRARDSGFGTMEVIANSSTREVKAVYTQDDFTLSVLITLPAAFPFRSAEVDCSKTIGVPADRLKRWSLQIRTMLNNQGGTLQDALKLWKDNVDKEFEGVEPCPVCYSVLHAKTHKLPTLKCKICSNRFHFDCLNQWFRSSGKNQCVLCQQPWQGTHV